MPQTDSKPNRKENGVPKDAKALHIGEETGSKILPGALSKRFFADARTRLKEAIRTSPSLRQAITLPARWDFHRRRVYLTRQQKAALQLGLSKLTKDQVREQIKVLWDLEHEKLAEAKRLDKKQIALPEDERSAQSAYQWAFYCREAAKFAEAYLQSLVYQKKI